MQVIGCDLHAPTTIAMLDSDTGELEEKTLEHQDETVRKFYAALPGPIPVGIEATGSMQWFLEMMEELGIECRVGHPAKIRKAEIGEVLQPWGNGCRLLRMRDFCQRMGCACCCCACCRFVCSGTGRLGG